MNFIGYKPEREPDKIIMTDNNVYMRRWHIQRCTETMSIYYHEILRSDWQEEFHDHPWESVSIILDGSYMDLSPEYPDGRLIEQGQVVYRSAKQAHRIILHNGPVETLFITGPVVRDWGFHCKKGFVPFEQYKKQGGCVE